ncbi:MAG: NAD(+) diphosphatase [Treponemataceae bacterium]
MNTPNETDINSLPPRAAFRFRSGSLRYPENATDTRPHSGLDPHFAVKNLGDPHFRVPTIDGRESLLIYIDDETAVVPEGWKEAPVRTVLSEAACAECAINTSDFFRAYHITQWRTESAYCGRCGSPNVDATDELARLCPKCGRREYVRISPAIIVLVTRDDGRALLAHNLKFREGLFSLVAGFVEAGESLEETVAREIREEVGVEVKEIRYHASQAWPFPNSLMLAFTARWASGEPRPDLKEIGDVAWFSPDTLPEIPPPGSISRALIDTWLKEVRT